MSKLTHLDESGAATMVDVAAKDVTARTAVAKGRVTMQPETLSAIEQGGVPKGDVLAVARTAGIMAAKRTADLIPLCHPLPIASVAIDLEPADDRRGIEITATVKVSGQTGVEMEALTAVSVVALTIYDMVKAVDKEMVIGDVRLIEKAGGRSGHYVREKVASLAPRAAASKKARSRAAQLSAGPAPTARDALRAFMVRHGLKVSDWSREAGVRTGEVFSFLNGQSTSLAPDTAKRLAKAAGVTVKDLFAG